MQHPTPFLSDFHTSSATPGSRARRPSRRRGRRKDDAGVNDTRNDSRNDTRNNTHRRSKSSTQIVKEKANQIRLYAWHELESWQQDNEFLHNGYRKATNSYRLSLASLSYIHNQTGNILSHLLGVVLFTIFGFFVSLELVPRYATADVYDIGIFAVFGAGAMVCFGLSAFFHTFGNHSEGVYHSWLLLDLYGILGLICGTVYSGTYYGFYCEPKIWLVYSVEITAITIIGGLICTIPRFRAPKYRVVRATVFGIIFFSGAVPMTHALKAFGREQVAKQMGWNWLVAEACLYVTGAMIYACRFPECIKPGAFDIWGNSHQVFHIFAVLGALIHLVGMIQAFDYNHNPATRRC
ncbi:hemolysin-III related-domain-containing protein [Amylocarpus encephaloides]|uniref:Hemolysin-III related-domain-containing protein n=1 Tax=Amylocarpus encephaloides TaxID=45428 RepID=A0A9P7YDI8_9HELO|nr:hemolysin-III related-domain-containing protein [Amylocarpus encephaloides]